MKQVASPSPPMASFPLKDIESGHFVGDLVTPRDGGGRTRGPLQYQLTPGGFYYSKELTAPLFGLKLLNASPALAELLEEVNHATPKQVFFFDSRPFLGGDLPYAVNWVDTAPNPDLIPVCVNPKSAAAETVAHELMHAWLECYLGLDDPRQYVDPADKPTSMMVNIVQSMVLDCTVLWQLKKRGGFDCDQFGRDLVAAAVACIEPYNRGLMHGSSFAQLVGAGCLAVPMAVPDLYELDGKDRRAIQELWRICRRYDPAMSWVAEKYCQALRRHGYDTYTGALRAIDESLFAAFEFLGKKFDPEKHMVKRVWRVRPLDKFPDFMSGAPLNAKFDALHLSVLNRRHVLHKRAPPNEIHMWLAPEGSPYSSLNLPPIVRPEDAGPQQKMDFFPLGLSDLEMDQLAANAVREGLISETLQSLPAPDIYGKSYTLAGALENNRDFFQRIGEHQNVLHA